MAGTEVKLDDLEREAFAEVIKRQPSIYESQAKEDKRIFERLKSILLDWRVEIILRDKI